MAIIREPIPGECKLTHADLDLSQGMCCGPFKIPTGAPINLMTLPRDGKAMSVAELAKRVEYMNPGGAYKSDITGYMLIKRMEQDARTAQAQGSIEGSGEQFVIPNNEPI